MLKQLILENWKSFRYAELPLDPLTVLIGTNASGKSNVVEALEFLQRIAQGENIESALAGDKTLASIRGGVEWAARKPESQFTLKVLMQGEDENTDYLYVIQIQTLPEVRVIKEYIEFETLNEKKVLTVKNYNFTSKSGLRFVDSSAESDELRQFNPFNEKKLLQGEDFLEILQNHYLPLKKKLNILVISSLQKSLILNPIPSQMRDYSRLSDTLESDVSNIAGVLAALSEQQKKEVESALSDYIKHLPEGDIKKVWAEKVGRFGTDAMLYCQEEWKPGEITEIDARSMSDGTLRFLAILTALLTRPEGSQLVIEEIDNGLHPSRAKLLVKILREIGSKRNIDILITTHNPALLDALGPEIVPFVVVAHRDSETGESKLTILEDIDNLPLLLASGTLGKLATKGAIEKSLSENK
ncbi:MULTISPECIES: ATP-binding protein [unclassified Nodularia (in: cyanobacteria)]|uniref:AAA family ATPase n=1 Tax=unclassified Nodularia (in: cyanobacteria) TaxID=2656917 RepID=UPI001881E676|nr:MULTISPECIES: ATP-binding protein [unclassified Nodularia (in: cyanobacteria)]MBE9198489.1 AAA family ATPase [Nodularia sp. LEGE 06071]MCC2691046.1 AAA family ATPase [Nodularia sp. LEGE 04288]